MPSARLLGACLAALLAVSGCSSATAPIVPAASQAARAAAPSVRYGTYAWNADAVVADWKGGRLWPLFAAKHVDDALLGFDDADIAKYSKPAGIQTMNALFAEGKQHGVRFELLLGDPSWIPPSGVPSLLAILHALRNVPFTGVHLDLEPNQVKGKPIATTLAQLVAAMKRYVAASPWPVTLDANWIYVNKGNKTTGGYCLPCGLAQQSHLRNIALMTYIADPKTVLAVDGPILDGFPDFAFSISQSVEPPAVLPPHDSYWGDGFKVFLADMQRLDGLLRAKKNYAGITIESWQYLETMPP